MPTRLPLFVIDDQVILPGMVVPIELDDDSKAAIDAAVAEADDTLLVAPRLEDRYPAYAVIAKIVQRGRTHSGEPAVVVKGQSRARLGQGDGGPDGAALWMDVEPIEVGEPDEETTALASEYRALLVAYLQRRNAWQIIESVNRVNDPSALADLAGYASYLSTAEKRDLLETPDTRERLTKLIARLRQHIAEAELSDKIASDVREGVDKTQRSTSCASSSPQSARSSATSPTARTTTGPASRPPSCPRRCARRRCARSASSSGPATIARKPATCAPGSTPSSSSRGARRRSTRPTSRRRARSSTPTTTASTT